MFEAVQILQQLGSLDVSGLSAVSPLLIVAALFFLTFISEDAACVSAGMLAAHGEISFATAVTACFAGILAGDVSLYWVGRFFGRGLLDNRLISRFVSADSVTRTANWLERRGASVVFFSRFVTGLRLPTYLAAGIFRSSFQKFLFYFTLAALVWTPIAVGVAFLSSGLFAGSIFIGVVAAFLGLRLTAKLLSHQNRRLAVGRIKRLLNWEFWPVRVFYFPVFIYVLVLAVRHRCLTVFTCANPSITSGGLVGESKESIYGAIGRSLKATDHILKYTKIGGTLSLSAKLTEVRNFIKTNCLAFPIVLKPDVGERGKGVMIAQTFEQVSDYLSRSSSDTIVQEFFDGVEASVFYYRYPDQEKGKVFSITEKQFPTLLGDGRSDLRMLILNDSRAVALAQSYFDQNKDRLDRVPERDEAVELINIGTHSRGAVFVDGECLRTAVLEGAIDEICRGIDGFYFGRFDLRAKSFTDFQNGGPFKIIELNGVSSESTNIYDPRFSLFDAYAILFRQWRIAFEIGAENRARGFEPTRLNELFGLIFPLKMRQAGISKLVLS